MAVAYSWKISVDQLYKNYYSKHYFLPTEAEITFNISGRIYSRPYNACSENFIRLSVRPALGLAVYKGYTKAARVEIAVRVANTMIADRRLFIWEQEIKFPAVHLPFQSMREFQLPYKTTIFCEITWHGFVNFLQSHLNCEKYFMNSELSDFVIEVKGTEYPVHKIILATQSEVFQKMFATDMKEMSENRMIIPDLSPEIMEKLLTYFYSGNVHGLAKDYDLSKELLALADKYEITGLKKLCVGALMERLNLENGLEILRVADLYQADELTKYTLKFMVENKKDVRTVPEFEEFMKTNPNYLFQFMEEILK